MTATEYKLQDTKIRRCAYPLSMGEGDIAILGLHGYMGYPGELYYPARILSESGFHVSVPRFPGHGTCGEDFNLSTGRQWLRSGIDAFLELKDRYDSVYIMGHSMGCIMASLIASRFHVDKMVFMAPALEIKYPLFMAEPASFFINKVLNNPLWEADTTVCFHDERDDDDDLYLGQEYWTWSYFRRLADLSKLRRQAVKRLPLIQGDILNVMGRKDPTVPLKAASLIERRINGLVRSEILENSGHLVPYDKDYIKCGELVLDWFSI